MRFYATPHRMGIYGYHGINSFSALNRYGHPADETLLRFGETKTPVIATKDRGGIIIYKEKDKLSVDCFLNTK